MRMAYLAVLAACVIGTLPLELVLHTRVYGRPLRLLLTLLLPGPGASASSVSAAWARA